MAPSLISQTSFGAANFYRNDFEINFNLLLCHVKIKLAAVLIKRGLTNVLLRTLFNVISNIVQHGYTLFRFSNIQQFRQQDISRIHIRDGKLVCKNLSAV